ncbi:MAG: TonB-dependent receptor [Lysobacterales bacterium]
MRKPTRNRQTPRRTLLALMLSAALVAQAQTPERALVDVYGFDAVAGPTADYRLRVDGVEQQPNDYGALRLDLASGEHQLEILRQGQVVTTLPLTTKAGEIAELIINFERDGQASVSLESSAQSTQDLAEQPVIADPGTLEGQILNAENGKPVAGARVYIAGTPIDLTTDAEGRFKADLPGGSYSVSVLAPSFASQTLDAVEIPAKGKATRNIELTPAGLELAEFVVTEPYVEGSLAAFVEEKRTSSAVTDIIGAEQIARSGDSDAAGALRRVTGLTLVDGKFVYVRGLGERYSSTLLNNAQIPSPDPTRRVVPLDLFPTEILQGIVIQKTFTADMPGEFGGGTIQLRTRGVPEGFVAKVQISGTYLDGTTGSEGLTYRGDDSDWTGFEGGTRDLPTAVADRIAQDGRLRPRTTFNPGGVTPAEYEAYGETFAQRGFNQSRPSLPPGANVSASLGNVWQFGNNKVGFLSSLRYNNQWDTTQETRRRFNVQGADTLILGAELERLRTEQNIELSAFLNAGIEFGENHKLTSTTVLVRQTTDEARFTEGYTEDPGDRSRFYQNQWNENFLISQQISGEHIFPRLSNLTVDWQSTNARAGRDAPSDVQIRYDQDNNSGEYRFSSRADSNSIEFGELDDSAKEYSLNLKLPWQFADDSSVTFSAGASQLRRDRDSGILRFAYRAVGALSRNPAILRLTPNEIFVPANIGPGGFQFDQTGRDTDFYVAEQSLDALYASADLVWHEDWRLTVGARQEDNFQLVSTGDPTQPGAAITEARIEQKDLLPSASLTWVRTEKDQFRVGYSETLSRPDFRELSAAPFTDPLLDTETIGNPDLVSTSIKNYDLRWEYYFTDSESFTASLFMKKFDQPIERVLVPGTGELLTYVNVQSATLRGIEFDIYKTLGMLADKGWANPQWLPDFHWENWYVSSNYAYIDSTIELGSAASIQTTRERPLQGQSPYVANFQLGYINPESGRETSLVYNRFGRRISNVGTFGAPDIYEEPFNQLDLVYKQSLPWSGWTLKARAKNLLDPTVEFTQGDGITREYRKGRELNLAIEWKW